MSVRVPALPAMATAIVYRPYLGDFAEGVVPDPEHVYKTLPLRLLPLDNGSVSVVGIDWCWPGRGKVTLADVLRCTLVAGGDETGWLARSGNEYSEIMPSRREALWNMINLLEGRRNLHVVYGARGERLLDRYAPTA